jgi:hypothetical protein
MSPATLRRRVITNLTPDNTQYVLGIAILALLGLTLLEGLWSRWRDTPAVLVLAFGWLGWLGCVALAVMHFSLEGKP